MKAARTGLLVLILLLVCPALAHANQPSIQQTSQWKNMKNYVALLQSLQGTPATLAQKEAFTNNLSNKQLATNNRVKSLYSRSIQEIVNRDQRAEKKQINKVRSSEKAQIKQLQSQRKQALGKERSRLSKTQASLRNALGGQIKSSKTTLRRLQDNLRKTTNPFRREVILSHINTVELKISRLNGSLRRQLSDAQAASAQRVSVIRRNFAERADNTRARYQAIVERIQDAWKKIYRQDVLAAKERRQNQFQLVSNLRQRGNNYIAAMPPA